MSGRKQFDPDEALDAAVRVFWELGYSATSVGDLLSATGLSRSSLYASFGDKQQLFVSCLDRYVETVGTASKQAMHQETSDISDAVLAGFEAIVDRMADPAQPAGCLFAQTAAEAHSLPEPIRASVTRLLDNQIEQMRLLLARSAAPGTASDELISLATYLVAMAQAVAVMHRAGTAIPRLRETYEHAVAAMKAVMAASEPGSIGSAATPH